MKALLCLVALFSVSIANAGTKLSCKSTSYRSNLSFTIETEKEFVGEAGKDFNFYNSNGSPNTSVISRGNRAGGFELDLDGFNFIEFGKISDDDTATSGEIYMENYAGRVRNGGVECDIERY